MEDSEAFIKSTIAEAFNAICINFELKNYDAAAVIAIHLTGFMSYLTESQHTQLNIVMSRLTFLIGEQNANKPSE